MIPHLRAQLPGPWAISSRELVDVPDATISLQRVQRAFLAGHLVEEPWEHAPAWSLGYLSAFPSGDVSRRALVHFLSPPYSQPASSAFRSNLFPSVPLTCSSSIIPTCILPGAPSLTGSSPSGFFPLLSTFVCPAFPGHALATVS